LYEFYFFYKVSEFQQIFETESHEFSNYVLIHVIQKLPVPLSFVITLQQIQIQNGLNGQQRAPTKKSFTSQTSDRMSLPKADKRISIM